MPIIAWSDVVIAVRVPAGALPGAGSILITPALTGFAQSNSLPFTVLMTPKPVVLPGASSPRPILPPVSPVSEAPKPMGNTVLPPPTLPTAILSKRCTDPAAHRINFQVSGGRKSIKITGVVKNLGGPYETRSNQQQMSLYEGGRQIATAPFGNLAPGQEVSVVAELVGPNLPPGMPLPTHVYKLIISYDPDILLDGNKQNDDCNIGNNTKSRSGP